ncbi:MAG: dihydroorotase [Armatimonadetes bacterium]|nr:dihydroorotase [Armatimonadota bacterium]
MYDLVLKGGTVATATRTEVSDVGIVEGRIAALGSIRPDEAGEVVDVTGLHILPGVIDSQVHFREPGLTHKEDLESGSRAAVMGGVTSFFDEPNVEPTTTTRAALEDKIDVARGRIWCNAAFWVGASNDNLDELAELEMLPGTPGVGEVFMGSSTGPLLVADDASLLKVLQNGTRPVAIHAEDEFRLRERKALLSEHPHVREHPNLRDVESSRLATERVLRLSRQTGRRVHVLHVSTADELPLLARAKEEGLGTTCEVTPQHLSFTDADYESLGTKIQMNTPIRDATHQASLWNAVRTGLFDVLGSDHAPHTNEEKSRPYPGSPSGIPGVQTMLPVMLDWVTKGALTLSRLIEMTSRNPARIFGVRDRGSITVGHWADIAVVDLGATFEVTQRWLQSKCAWSPFEGRTLHGKPIHTLVNGSFAVRDGQLLESGLGRIVDFDWK